MEGELEGDLVTCHWHSWEHNVQTGILWELIYYLNNYSKEEPS